MMTSKAIAIIPARGGSKGLPQKNVSNLAGKPLIAWTIDVCLRSQYINKTIVTSDDASILEVAQQYGAETIKRPEKLATDNALTVDVITHALGVLEYEVDLESYKYVVLMQPTSPLRNTKHVNEAFEKIISTEATSLVSVTKPLYHPFKAFRLVDGYLKGLVQDDHPFLPRQLLPETYVGNGAIYIIEIDLFKKTNSLMTSRCIPYEMDGISSIDIDTKLDLDKASAILLNKIQ